MSKGYKFAVSGGKVFDNVALVTGDYYSPVISLVDGNIMSVFLRLTSTSSLNATCILQVTNIPNPDESSDADWATSTQMSFTAATGTTIQQFKSSNGLHGALYRLKISHGSGTGVADAWTCNKKQR